MFAPSPLRALLIASVCLPLAGCHPRSGAAAKPPRSALEANVPPTSVSDAGFASAVHQLLRDGTASASRSSLMAGTINRALAHTAERFADHQNERGMATLTGALYLARVGEFRPAMLAGAANALRSGAGAVCQAGDEGRALALLTLERLELPADSPEAKDVDAHLAALQAWIRDTASGTTVESLGDRERIAVSRALLDPSAEATQEARTIVINWVEKALQFQEERSGGKAKPKREEAVEAFRAFRSGAQTIAALHLRSGDAASAYEALSMPVFRKVTPPALYDRIDAAASGGDAGAWRDLLVWLWAPQHRRGGAEADMMEDPELAIDPSLLRAALWGTAIEAYRRDPTQLDVAMALATLLVQHGLAEASPLVLADAAAAKPDAAKLAVALRFVLQAIATEDESDDIAGARRVFAAAGQLLTVARRPEFKGKLAPSADRLQMAMASIETRSANLEAARTLLESALANDPSADGLITLASIERQEGKLPAALASLNRALGAPDARKNPITSAEAHLAAFEVQRQVGAVEKARTELTEALGAALEARRSSQNPTDRSRAERILARVLDRFSDSSGAARALERAYSAARDDRQQIAATLLDMSARALIAGDVNAARKATDRALNEKLADGDLVYSALWLQMMERAARAAKGQNQVRSDDTSTRALVSIQDDGRWTSRLASWGLGKIKDQDLLMSARTPVQKTEASFYLALSRRAAGDAASADAALREVLHSPAINLMEVQLARDLVAGPNRNLAGPPPYSAP